MKLNPDQQRVVDCDGHCVVVACPGSGKTRVITIKIGELFRRNPNARLCAVTFTRDAAGELTRRAEKEIGSERLKHSCRIGTFHSLIIRQLRNHNRLGKIVGPGQQAQLLKRAIAMSNSDLNFAKASAVIEAAKAGYTPTDEVDPDPDLVAAYEELLSRHSASDLYDVVRNAVAWMKDGSIHAYPVDYMLVDEFQDTDPLQLEWILLHAKNGTNVTVVGDDDQSIYGWRGALGYGGMESFLKETGGERITLGINYRCYSEILGAADNLIQNNGARVEKKLVAGRGPGGSVHQVRCASFLDEAEQAVDAIQEDIIPYPDSSTFSYTVPEGSWAVLARGRRALDKIENVLQRRGIAYYRPPKESFWSRPPQSLMLGLLDSLKSSNDVGLESALHHALTCTAGRGKASDLTRALSQKSQGNLFRLLTEGPLDTQEFMAKEAELIVDLGRGLKSWRAQLASGRIKLVVRGVSRWFAQFESSEDDQEQILGAGETICKLRGPLHERIALLTDTAAGDGAPRGVQLQTMHGSKGLEFDNVWIVRANHDSIPSPNSPDYEEERRLFYVAMTRAKNRLFISNRVSMHPSPFLAELGPLLKAA